MKKYTNLIVLGVLVLAAAVYLIIKNVDFYDVLLSMGYYDEKVSVINTADVHGHIVYDDDVGGYYTLDQVDLIMGMPLMKYFINEERMKSKNTLLLDGGDMFHGTNEANIEKGKGVVEVANLMGYDAMTPGNHDFNFGFSRLMEIKSQLNFPMLSANIYKDGKLVFEEYKIVEVGGKKIGLFGLTVQDALRYTNSRETDGVTLEDPYEAAARVVPVLKKQVDAVILLSHLGPDIDREVARQVDGIDLILSAHYHILFKTAEKINNTYLAEAGGYSTHVGLAGMYFKNGKVSKVVWKVKNTRDKSKVDKSLDAVAQKYHAIAFESAKEVIGKAKVKLNGIRSQVRSRETNLANVLTDAMREAGDADIALMNGGGIRESMPEGDITLYRIGKVFPFINSLVVIELKGDKIYSAIERGLRTYPSGLNGGFLQVSGISYEFDGSKPAGERLVSVTRDGQPLDKNKIYRVATNDYLYNGGDDYDEFTGAKLVSKGELLKDMLAKYIKSKGEVSPKVDGRIKVTNERYK